MKRISSIRKSSCRGFSFLELLVAMAILAVVLIILTSTLDLSMRLFGHSDQKVEKMQKTRAALELMSREVTTAVVDTRMQFAILPGSELQKEVGVSDVVAEAPVILFMAPLGQNNHLYCVGYYLSRDDELKNYGLKRLLIPPQDPENPGKPHPAFPRLPEKSETSGRGGLSPVHASWFLKNWDKSLFDDMDPENDNALVGTVADGIIGFWVQCYDRLGNPIPRLSDSKVHPKSNLIYNSAGLFYMSTATPFDGGDSFRYTGDHELAMRAHRLPAEMEFRICTLDRDELIRVEDLPEMTVVNKGETVDLSGSVQHFESQLSHAGYNSSRFFALRISLMNGG